MSEPQVALLMLGLLLFFIMLGFPVAFTLMAMGVGFGYYAYAEPTQLDHVFQNRVFDLLVNQTFSVMANDVLVAVPLFLFMGYVVERTNIIGRLFESLQLAARRVPGAMAVAALATCTLFATATGIVGAVVTLMGLLALPSMLKAQYDVRLSTGVICAGGCLGILIPPSVMLIVYAATSGISAVRLYAGAMIPGFLLAGLYMLYVIVRATLQPRLAPKPPEAAQPIPFRKLAYLVATSIFPLSILILAVLGAIIFGLATPTEAAALGALGALALAIGYRTLRWATLQEAVYLTARSTAMVCWLFIGSAIFASVFSYLGGQVLIKEWVLGFELSPIQFLILVQFIIFLLGWPLEWTEIIIIFVPIFLPLLPHFGIDPLLFGILVALNLQTSFLSPPVAMAAFYLKGVAPPQVQLTDIFKGCLPFLWIVLFSLALVYMVPQLATWLPEALYGAR